MLRRILKNSIIATTLALLRGVQIQTNPNKNCKLIQTKSKKAKNRIDLDVFESLTDRSSFEVFPRNRTKPNQNVHITIYYKKK